MNMGQHEALCPWSRLLTQVRGARFCWGCSPGEKDFPGPRAHSPPARQYNVPSTKLLHQLVPLPDATVNTGIPERVADLGSMDGPQSLAPHLQ